MVFLYPFYTSMYLGVETMLIFTTLYTYEKVSLSKNVENSLRRSLSVLSQ